MTITIRTPYVLAALLVCGLALAPLRSHEPNSSLALSQAAIERLPPVTDASQQTTPVSASQTITRLPPVTQTITRLPAVEPIRKRAPSLSQPPPTEELPLQTPPPHLQPPAQPHLPNRVGESWWEGDVVVPLQRDARPASLSLDEAVLATLSHSPQVKALSDQALVRELAIGEAASKFDVTTFLNSRFTSNNDAVGNTLTTGGASRFIDTNWYTTGGVRKLQANGGKWELSQQLGWQDTNSIYFVPSNQATTKMALTYTQPLLRGAGCDYQNSVIVLAELNAALGSEQLNRDLQGVVVEVHRYYWDLYLQRAAYLQRRRLYSNAQEILDELVARQDIDALQSQIVRAKAALRDREAATVRYGINAKNAESRLLTVIGDPNLPLVPGLEVVPIQPPHSSSTPPELSVLLERALEHRPEIHQALQNIKAATIRVRVAENEIKPTLNLVLGSYLNALQGNSNFGQSYIDQFSTGRPSAFVGVEFESPWGNRAARSRLDQRQVELRQLTYELQNVTNHVRMDIVIAQREIQATAIELKSREAAVRALREEIDYLTSRWRLLPGEGQEAGVVLDNILQAQERLSDAELALVTAQVNLSMAHVQLMRSTGELLREQSVQPEAKTTTGEPVYSLRRQPTDQPASQSAAPPVAPTETYPSRPTEFSQNPSQARSSR